MDATLTATGVIATILSVFFAIAAYFVQHKKNKQSQNSAQAATAPKPEEPHVVTTRQGVIKEKKRQSEVAASKPAPKPQPPPPVATVDDTGQKPIFKKYTAKGGYEEDAGLNEEDEALWE